MFDLGPHAGFIWLSYSAAGVIVMPPTWKEDGLVSSSRLVQGAELELSGGRLA
jgi:hypothetical protein